MDSAAIHNHVDSFVDCVVQICAGNSLVKIVYRSKDDKQITCRSVNKMTICFFVNLSHYSSLAMSSKQRSFQPSMFISSAETKLRGSIPTLPATKQC